MWRPKQRWGIQHKDVKEKEKKEKWGQSKRSLRQLQAYSTFALQESQKEKRERAENLFEDKVAKNVLNLWKETDFQIQEAQRVLMQRTTSRHIVITMAKIKR